MPQKIYVINANEEVLNLFHEILSERGYDVTSQPFPLQRTAEVKEFAPNLVVLDFIITEEEKGWEALEMLKLDNALRNVPVLVCSAPGHRLEEMDSYLKEKGIRVLLKPFDADELVDMVEETISNPTFRHAVLNRADGRTDRH